MKRRIVLVGPPASGKGTQAEMIQARYGLPVASPGAMLREETRIGSSIGLEADRLTSQGLLVPDSVVLGVVSRWLDQVDGGFVFDGFPRTLVQAEGLDQLLEKRGTPLEAVIGFTADLATLQHRVLNRAVCRQCGRTLSVGLHVDSAQSVCPSCGGELVKRKDDTLATLALRMQEYEIKTAPLSGYYAGRGLLYPIESSVSPEAVFEKVAQILDAE